MKHIGRPAKTKKEKFKVVGVSFPPPLLKTIDQMAKAQSERLGFHVSRSALIAKLVAHYLSEESQ